MAAGLALGMFIAWFDSRSGWDDAGITALALFFGAGVVGLFVRRRPWIFGLAIGMWMPVLSAIRGSDVRALFIFVFPLAGVYAGYGLRRLASADRRAP
jgi:hypothetical protein